jgi:hypothetical protein
VKRAVKVLGDSAAEVHHFDTIVVELVQQMRGKLTATTPLIALRDHDRSSGAPR